MSSRDEVLELLRENARYSVSDLARLTDLDEAEVATAITDFEEAGIVRGYKAVVDWEQADPQRVEALVELNVTLDRETSYDDIAERLAGFPQVTSLRLVSGDYDFAMEVDGDSMTEVSHFISEKVAPVPEITQTVTHYIMDTYKKSGVRFEDHDDDDRLSVTP